MRKWLLLVAILLHVALNAASAQSGTTARNQAGDSALASDGSSYVEIPPDIPPESFFTITYNPGTPLSGIPKWYDVEDGDGFASDFKREFNVIFEGVEMSMPMAFSLGRKESQPPFPAPEFVVSGAEEMDSREGKSPELPYEAYYMTDRITDSTIVNVLDKLKSYIKSPGSGNNPPDIAYRWSLEKVSELEPVAITSSLLFELPASAASLDTEYGLIVPFSEGGDYLPSVEANTGKPIYHPRLRAIYLHKPDNMKVKLWWEPASALKAWHTPFKARTDRNEYYLNGGIQNGHEFVHKDDSNPIFVEAIEPQKAKLKWGIGSKYHAIEVIPVDMAVDANRDGFIKFAGNLNDPNGAGKPVDKTEKTKPARMWVNSDNDGTGDGAEDMGGAADGGDTEIKSKRDLEDFFRLHLYFGGLQAQIADGTYTVGLKWKSVTGVPSIKVYEAVEGDGGTAYLTSDSTAASQIGGNYKTVKATVKEMNATMLPTSVFSGLSGNTPSTYLLFEAAAEGKGQLVMTIHKADGTEIGEGPGIWVELKNVKKMYQRADSAVAHPWENVAFEPDPNEDSQNVIIFVHGWRMSPEGAGNFAESMYKRLWHRGYKGRFAAFHWDTWWSNSWEWLPYVGGAIDAYLANYNDSEHTAWQAAAALKTFVNGLPFANKHIAAHSMGNIVTGEALKQGMTINNYALMQAAVPAACYDESEANIKQTQQYNHLAFTMWDNLTPDDDPDPVTKALAYRGRFKNVSGNLVNFFLPQDQATSFAWEINNDQAKPEGGLFSENFHYKHNNAAGQKLYKYTVEYYGEPPVSAEIVDHYLSDPYEAMPFACRTWGKAVGAWGTTDGSINLPLAVNLSNNTYNLPGENSGFGDEHSAQFNFRIQQLKPFYDTLMDELEVPRNP